MQWFMATDHQIYATHIMHYTVMLDYLFQHMLVKNGQVLYLKVFYFSGVIKVKQ